MSKSSALSNFPYDDIDKANDEFVCISDDQAKEICQLYNALIKEGMEEPRAREATKECITTLHDVFSLEKRSRELLADVVNAVGHTPDMPEEKWQRIQALLGDDHESDGGSDPQQSTTTIESNKEGEQAEGKPS